MLSLGKFLDLAKSASVKVLTNIMSECTMIRIAPTGENFLQNIAFNVRLTVTFFKFLIHSNQLDVELEAVGISITAVRFQPELISAVERKQLGM